MKELTDTEVEEVDVNNLVTSIFDSPENLLNLL